MPAPYLTSPPPSAKMPPGIPYIVGNETAERFSFYGMKAVLFIFMTEYLMAAGGVGHDVMTADQAKESVHWFVASAYLFPIVGAIVADALLGKYATILYLSAVYCLGHLALAMDHSRFYLFVGLTLIAIGTGAIKPCVSAHVGDQFGSKNQHLVTKVFHWFYFAINLGAAASTWLTPFLMHDKRFGPAWAFGVPGVLMALATLIFWLGRYKFVHVPPAGMASVRNALSGDGLLAIGNLAKIYVFVAVFWCLFDQTSSAWIQQAKRMDRHWLGIEWLPSQIQIANPILIMVFVPLFSYGIYPAIHRFFRLTPLRKVAIGFFVTVPAFAIPMWIETELTGGQVVAVSSEEATGAWRAENVLDGRTDGTGCLPARPDAALSAQQIVVRLRERRPWPISAVRLYPRVDLDELLRKEGGEKKDARRRADTSTDQMPSTLDSRGCWAKDVEILVGRSPLGDPETDATGRPMRDASGRSLFAWTRSVGTMRLQAEDRWQSVEFPAVSAEYVMIRIKSNWGGARSPYVGLGEVAIETEGGSPVDRTTDANFDRWNVAAIGSMPNIGWQLLAYVFMTAAEVMVSITCLEFSYTQAPNKMKSFVMSLYLLSVSAGNGFTAAVNRWIQNADQTSKLEGAAYYGFFTLVMLVAAIGFVFVAQAYRGRTYIQGET
ncbi:MAG: POT family MFS transporter [Pirellulales bacterium]